MYIHRYVYIYIQKETYKELAPVIMEAGKSHDLQGELVSWRPRKADGVVLFQVQRPKNQKADLTVQF